MSQGRKPSGVKLVEDVEASSTAKERMALILRTLVGDLSIAQASATLGISESAFHKLRRAWMQASAAALEPRPRGRPARAGQETSEREAALAQEVERLKFDLEAARVRELIALEMPHLLVDREKEASPSRLKKNAPHASFTQEEGQESLGRREARHVACVKRITDQSDGPSRVARRRVCRRQVRRTTVAVARWGRWRGLGRGDVAAALGVSQRTLRRWAQRWDRGRLRGKGQGRPRREVSPQRRNDVLRVMHGRPITAGVPRLYREHSDIPRALLEDMTGRYKRLYRKMRRIQLLHLTWTLPGTVWSVDHSEPPQPVDGLDPQILSVRDLPSGYQPLWAGVPDAGAITAAERLEALFTLHGAPLVLKSDNGSAFKAHLFQQMLMRWGVVWLPSPPRYPRYNGSCEAGIGALAVRTQREAAAAGRPGIWQSEDLAAARALANQTRRGAWEVRERVSHELRQAFIACVRKSVALSRERQLGTSNSEPSRADQRKTYRSAVERTLVKTGLLEVRRSAIPQPIKSFFRDRIT